MVTSAIAAPALPAVKNKRASARCSFSCNDKINMEITPRDPVKKRPRTIRLDNYVIAMFMLLHNKHSEL